MHNLFVVGELDFLFPSQKLGQNVCTFCKCQHCQAVYWTVDTRLYVVPHVEVSL